ncbi:hypothetical protein AAC387_Pa07g3427 [Persea americana]
MVLKHIFKATRARIVVLIFSLSILSPFLLYLAFQGHPSHSPDQWYFPKGLSKQLFQIKDWKEEMPLQPMKSPSKEVFDAITVDTHELEPRSADFLSMNPSQSWETHGSNDTNVENKKFVETNERVPNLEREPSKAKGERVVIALDRLARVQEHKNAIAAEPSQYFKTATGLPRMLLNKTRHEREASVPVHQNEAIVQPENAAIKRSTPIESAVLGKYSMWKRGKENETKLDSNVRLMRDQMIMARVYSVLATRKKKIDLYKELLAQLKDSQDAFGDADFDEDLHHSAPKKIKAMDQLLSKAREQLYDCKLVTHELRVMILSADEQVRRLRKESTFLSQMAAKTVPSGINCLSMRLTTAYYLLPPEKRMFARKENLENPNLYHYAIFSDNVLAAAVVVNSTTMHAKEPEKHVFHLVTDKLNFGAMSMWFLLNPPGKATIDVENIDNLKWLNSSYCPVLRQLESAAMKEYYFNADRISAGSSNLKYRNPKYLSMLNHLRFYLPQIYPKLDKILFLDDDVVVQKDLTGLWSIDLHGKVNGAVETCGPSFHRFDKYLNFSNPHISKNFDPNACGWAYGMNIFDLNEWKRRDLTGIYHKWQNMNENRVLWNLGTLPPGLLTFYQLTHPLDKSWHVLGLGYNSSISEEDIENAAVIHYNGNMKPWLGLAITKYRSYWTKYVKYDNPYSQKCNITE